MRSKFGVLSIVLMLCLAVQAYAAPAGFVDKKADSFTIVLPKDWETLDKSGMAELGETPAGTTMVLAATAKAMYPKILAYDEDKGNLTQKEFEALPNAEVERMCGEFIKNVKSRVPDATNVTCARQKVAKGSAVVVTMDMGELKVRNSTWSFYRGPNKTTVVSSLCEVGNNAQIKQTDTALKSIKLFDK